MSWQDDRDRDELMRRGLDFGASDREANNLRNQIRYEKEQEEAEARRREEEQQRYYENERRTFEENQRRIRNYDSYSGHSHSSGKGFGETLKGIGIIILLVLGFKIVNLTGETGDFFGSCTEVLGGAYTDCMNLLDCVSGCVWVCDDTCNYLSSL